MTEIKLIQYEIAEIKKLLFNLLDILPNFNITDEKILPYGLKPHTRSISWIVEQVIVQQAKYNGTVASLIYFTLFAIFGINFNYF